MIGLGVLSGLPFVYLTDYPHHPELRYGYRIYLITIYAVYFIYQWRHTGQTLAMKTWHLQVVDSHSFSPPRYSQALKRYVAALCCFVTGLNVITLIFDKQHRWLHDIFSGTITITTKVKVAAPANDE